MRNGTAVRIGDIADVAIGPEMRRGLAELERAGRGRPGGIIVMRHGENARNVIKNVERNLRS